MSDVPICHGHGWAELVSGKDIYPHRSDLAHLKFWQCAVCRSRVGCHPRTMIALGSLASAELRRARKDAHEAFDPLWKSGRMSRKKAYSWLANKLGVDEAHMGSMDEEQCQRVIEICNKPKEIT